MIEFKNVSKVYGEKKALKELNLTIQQGEIFGLLGHNGAGKSTAIKSLVSIIQPTNGTITVDNLDLGELLPLDLDEIVPPGMDIDSVEWFIQEKYDKTFKKAGWIILNKDETIGNVNVFRTNEDSSTVKNYEELSSLYDRVNELFSERNKEQEQFLKSLSLFLKSQNEKDRELDELKNRIDSLNSDVKKRKKGK